MNIRNVVENAAPVMPVLTIPTASQAVPLARALAEGGLRVIEVTLRTPDALDSIAAIRDALPDLVVGAGTVLTPKLMGRVAGAGGQFAVSPGFTQTLADAAAECSLPYLPGVVTASEVQTAVEADLETLKFFPASALGGAALLRNYASVFPSVRFCPTGGIGADTMGDYLALDNVPCVGGSWLAPRSLLETGDYAAITRLAARAVSTRDG